MSVAIRKKTFKEQRTAALIIEKKQIRKSDTM